MNRSVANVPTKLLAYNVYNEGNQLVGIEAEVELPTFKAITNEIAGAGFAGTMDDPTPGLFEGAELSISFRNISDDSVKLIEPKSHTLHLYASQRSTNKEKGVYVDTGLKVTMRGYPKEYAAGKAKGGEGTSTTVKFELDYIKITKENSTMIEMDKFNFIYVVNDVDYFAHIRNMI